MWGCMNYHVLNRMTINREYSLLRIDNMFSQLLGAFIFSEIDFLSRYHTHGAKWKCAKSAIHIWYNHYKFLVMPFGLTNTPLVFMGLMNQAFHGYLDKWFVECNVDKLVCATNCVVHGRHLISLLEVLSKRYSSPSSWDASIGLKKCHS
jgi:hypothetical protein